MSNIRHKECWLSGEVVRVCTPYSARVELYTVRTVVVIRVMSYGERGRNQPSRGTGFPARWRGACGGANTFCPLEEGGEMKAVP